MFGPHLIIDGTRCNTRKLADRILVEQVMNDYPSAIGMTKIGGPYMFEYQAPDPAYSGVSGIVVIAESHIAIHTFPELDYFTMDIFSCKNFDHEIAIEYIRKAFDVQEMDRMLVQRGLSFRGPHHGKLGATDDLIAAAQARLDAGIVSKEPALPDDLSGDRSAAVARHVEQRASGASESNAGAMLWPQYGVTPDLGTYGNPIVAANADMLPSAEPIHPLHARGGATIIPLTHAGGEPLGADGAPLLAGEAVQVNPTASISGLLDKLSATAGVGRRLGRSLATWERLTRDPETSIVLTLATPVIAEGLREQLVYAVEHRYVDVVVASADDLYADLYEALGFAHFAGEDGPVATEAGREYTGAFVATFLDGLEPGAVLSGADLWRRLGAALPTRAPRKGLLQAAAAADVAIFAADLSTSLFGGLLLAARARGVDAKTLALDPADDIVTLARHLARAPKFGVLRGGEGAPDALVAQACEVASALGLSAPTLSGSVSLGAARPLASGATHEALLIDTALALPLLLTGLAQRVAGTRRVAPQVAAMLAEARAEEPALA